MSDDTVANHVEIERVKDGVIEGAHVATKWEEGDGTRVALLHLAQTAAHQSEVALVHDASRPLAFSEELNVFFGWPPDSHVVEQASKGWVRLAHLLDQLIVP